MEEKQQKKMKSDPLLNERWHEAQKCLNIAEVAFKETNYERALKFINKAIQIYPTSHTMRLKQICETKLKEATTKGFKEPSSRKEPKRNFSNEQHALWKEILAKK